MNINTKENERIALFIDGANFYATARALGFDIDYKRLLELFPIKAVSSARFITRHLSKTRIFADPAIGRLARL